MRPTVALSQAARLRQFFVPRRALDRLLTFPGTPRPNGDARPRVLSYP